MCVLYMGSHLCTFVHMNTTLLTYKAMSHTVFLEFCSLTKHSGKIGRLKSVKIFPYESKVIFYT